MSYMTLARKAAQRWPATPTTAAPSSARAKKAQSPSPSPKRRVIRSGQSKAAQQRQRERQAQLQKRGDDFYAAAEALMPPKKTGFAALMAKQPNPLLASSEYAKAADAYAAAGLNEKAIAAYRKASRCHNESNAPHTAARCLERAALIASDGEKAKLAMESADTWAMAGEPLRGAEVALKLAASLEVDGARVGIKGDGPRFDKCRLAARARAPPEGRGLLLFKGLLSRSAAGERHTPGGVR